MISRSTHSHRGEAKDRRGPKDRPKRIDFRPGTGVPAMPIVFKMILSCNICKYEKRDAGRRDNDDKIAW